MFLLVLETEVAHAIPKRALGGPGEVEAFRQLLQRTIGARPAGFPVLPAPTTGPPSPPSAA